MSLVATKTGGADFENVPEGRYIARCYRVIDLGTQDVTYQGNIKQSPKILIGWELLSLPGGDEAPKRDDDKPFTIQKRYTLSLHEKSALRPDLEGWRGKRFTKEEEDGFDLKKLIGAYCEMQVIHNEGKDGNTYANIQALLSTKEKPKAVNEDLFFDLSHPDMKVFEELSDKLQDTIKASPEWVGMQKAADKEGTEVGGEKKKEAAPAKADAPAEPDKKDDAEIDDIPF